MRIVIDTNIRISGLLWRGIPWTLLRMAEAGTVELCMAPEMLDELAAVLHYERLQPRLKQIGLTPAELIAYALDLASMFEVPQGDPIVIADPDDDVFLRCAVVARAACVIPGDTHLLDLARYQAIPILTVREFLSQELPSRSDTAEAQESG